MLMVPPHYNAMQYNGHKVARGETVDVLTRDIKAMTEAGWKPLYNEPADDADADPEPKPKPKPKPSNRKPSKES